MQNKIIYNAQWAKENISMPELLSVFGHEPVTVKKHGSEYWYISPFRYEKEPSFVSVRATPYCFVADGEPSLLQPK